MNDTNALTAALSRERERDDFRPRVLVTKIGLDGHDRGSRIVAAACRDAGMEVIYTPPWQSIAAVVKLALEEDVDVVGISSLATDHLIVPKLMTALRDAGLGNVRVVVGGIVPDNEEAQLLASGVREVFHPGSTMDEITDPHARLRARSAPRRRAGQIRGEAMNKPIDLEPARRRRRLAGARALAARLPRRDRRRPRGRQRLRHPDPAALQRRRPRAPAATTRSAIPASPTTRAASTRPCTAAAPGRSASWSASARRPTTTQRLLGLLERGATAVSLIPCNSVYRGSTWTRSSPSCSAPAASSSTTPTTWSAASTASTSARSRAR